MFDRLIIVRTHGQTPVSAELLSATNASIAPTSNGTKNGPVNDGNMVAC